MQQNITYARTRERDGQKEYANARGGAMIDNRVMKRSKSEGENKKGVASGRSLTK
jgi:hypothetical protein